MSGYLLALFQTILELSIVGTYVILFVLVARLLLRKAPRWCSYVLWGVVFLRLVCPVFPEGQFSLIPANVETITNSLWQQESRSSQVQVSLATQGVTLSDRNAAHSITEEGNLPQSTSTDTSANLATQKPFVGQSANELPDTTTAYVASGDVTNHTAAQTTYQPWLVVAFIWLAGVCVLAVYHVCSYQRLKAKVKQAQEIEPGVCEIQGEHLSFVLGILRPTIYLSEGLDAESRKVILCHERVHLQRKDYLTKPLALGICCIHWFNPLVWLAFYLMNKDCEMSCDEKVVSTLGEDSKKVYSYALLDEATKGQYKKDRRVTSCASLSFGEESVKSRIQHVLNYRKASFWVIAVIVVALVVVMVGLCCNPKNEDSIVGEETKEQSETSETEETWNNSDKEEAVSARQQDAESALYCFADSFVNRDGNALYALTTDKDGFENWNMVTPLENGGYAFGDSSPWPQEGCYTVEYEEGSEEAKIRFLLFTSVPEVSVAVETVTLEQVDGLYYVNHKEYKSYSRINTADELKEAYRLDDEYYFTVEDTGYTKSFFQILRNHILEGTNPEYYNGYRNAVSSAKLLLNLGDGEGEVTGYTSMGDKQTPNAIGIGEGAVCIIRYTFAEDGSSVEIPMVLADESTGLYALGCELSKEVDETPQVVGDFFARKVYMTLEGDTVSYQLSDWGAYLLEEDDLLYKCVYPYYLPEDIVADVDGDILYFPTDSQTYEGAIDWMYDSMCVITPGEGGYSTFPLDETAQRILPVQWMAVDEGYVYLFAKNNNSPYVFILEDTNAVWEDKVPEDLTAEELNAWGIANRNYILEHHYQFVEVGYSTADELFTMIDMDGDGVSERISITQDAEGWSRSGSDWVPFDQFILRAGEGMETRTSWNMSNGIWAFSPDGERIFLALYEDGPSADPLTTIFKYEDNRLREAGTIANDVRNVNIVDGRITTTIRNDAIQTSAIRVQYFLNEAGDVEMVQEEAYEFAYWNEQNIQLLQNVELRGDLRKPETTFVLEPQQVWFTLLDNTMDDTGNWIYLYSASGKGGWFHVENGYLVGDEQIPSEQIFEGLQFAG